MVYRFPGRCGGTPGSFLTPGPFPGEPAGSPRLVFLASRSCPCEQMTHANPWTAPRALEEVAWEARHSEWIQASWFWIWSCPRGSGGPEDG